MAKVEIEIPENKVADITRDGDKVIVTFKEESHQLKDIKQVLGHIKNLSDSDVKWARDLWNEYTSNRIGSYSENVCLYRMVVAALTNNEERYLTTGERWFPVVQFCIPGMEKNCWGKEIIGTIESEGQKYTVVSGNAFDGSNMGLGFFNLDNYMSYTDRLVAFRSVSSKEVAEHISKYFGRLLFEVHYGGLNCDWRWVD